MGFELPTLTTTTTTTSLVPAGAIMSFDADDCPDGWELFPDLKGRFIVGAGSGNSDPSSIALSERTKGDTGGQEVTTGIPASTTDADEEGTKAPSPSAVPAMTSNTARCYAPEDETGASLSGDREDANMPPFISLTYCKKSAETTAVFTNAVSFYDLASCPSSWSAWANGKGRAILGAGEGNLAGLSSAVLTPRTRGAVGGREYTTGLPATTANATDKSPGPSLVFARAGSNTYHGGPSDTTLGGDATDSNMPPFVALNVCKSAENTYTALPTGMIVAFDLNACPAGWSVFNSAKGRMLIGSGSGNTDADGAALTSRGFGDTGGREYTTGIPAVSAPADDTSVAIGKFFSNATADIYMEEAADTTIFGPKEDSNMPPFWVGLYCQKD